MRNESRSETVLLDVVARLLSAQLPAGWQVEGPRLLSESSAALAPPPPPSRSAAPAAATTTESASYIEPTSRTQGDALQAADRSPGPYDIEGRFDAWLGLRAGRERAQLAVEIRTRFEPRDVERLVRAFGSRDRGRIARVADAPRRADGWLLVSNFLSPRSQTLLAEAGWNFADATGNVRIALERPALFLRLQGQARDPSPPQRPLRSLRGPVAGRLVRALVDFRPPYGIRELAKRARTSAAMASRVAAVLQRDAVIERDNRGRIERADWRALLVRWAEEYDFMRSNRVARFLALRGMKPVLDALRRTRREYAITGQLVAERRRTLAPSRLVIVYTTDIPALARELELEPAAATANTLLAEPFDPVALERSWQEDGLTFAALSQAAVDLLTSGDRSPRLAEALMEWMGENENEWRT